MPARNFCIDFHEGSVQFVKRDCFAAAKRAGVITCLKRNRDGKFTEINDDA